jgi:nucleoside-diphosphate-sugar epimerase
MAKKTVLLTGAFGNIGCFALRALLAQGYSVVAFDKDSPTSRNTSKPFLASGINIIWGDITKPEDVERAMQGVDAVIHLAGIFPPTSENVPTLSQAVNVDGTRNVIAAMEKSSAAKRLVFASSIAVYGREQGRLTPPLTASMALVPDDNYGKHKAECEKLIQASSLQWTINRIAACPPVNVANMASFKGAPLLENHPDSRVEFIHPADAALAFVNAVACDAAIGKILLLGGGKANQRTIRDMFNAMLAPIHLKPLPREAFNITDKIIFHGDWVDTTESQRLLDYQRHTVEQQNAEFWESLGAMKYLLVLLRPFAWLIHWFMLRTSPYYRKQNAS